MRFYQIKHLISIGRPNETNSSFGYLFNSTCIKENLLPSYTDIRNNNPTVRFEDCNLNFLMECLKENLKKCEEERKTAEQNAKWTEQEVRNKLKNETLYVTIQSKLNETCDAAKNETSRRTISKLNRMYDGAILSSDKIEPYVNISCQTLSKTNIKYFH